MEDSEVGLLPLRHLQRPLQLLGEHLPRLALGDVHKHAEEADGRPVAPPRHLAHGVEPAPAPVPGQQLVLHVVVGLARGVIHRAADVLILPLPLLRAQHVDPGFQLVGEVVLVVVAQHPAELVAPVHRRAHPLGVVGHAPHARMDHAVDHAVILLRLVQVVFKGGDPPPVPAVDGLHQLPQGGGELRRVQLFGQHTAGLGVAVKLCYDAPQLFSLVMLHTVLPSRRRSGCFSLFYLISGGIARPIAHLVPPERRLCLRSFLPLGGGPLGKRWLIPARADVERAPKGGPVPPW